VRTFADPAAGRIIINLRTAIVECHMAHRRLVENLGHDAGCEVQVRAGSARSAQEYEES